MFEAIMIVIWAATKATATVFAGVAAIKMVRRHAQAKTMGRRGH